MLRQNMCRGYTLGHDSTWPRFVFKGQKLSALGLDIKSINRLIISMLFMVIISPAKSVCFSACVLFASPVI